MNYLRSSKKTKAMAPEAYLLGGDSTHLEKNIKKKSTRIISPRN